MPEPFGLHARSFVWTKDAIAISGSRAFHVSFYSAHLTARRAHVRPTGLSIATAFHLALLRTVSSASILADLLGCFRISSITVETSRSPCGSRSASSVLASAYPCDAPWVSFRISRRRRTCSRSSSSRDHLLGSRDPSSSVHCLLGRPRTFALRVNPQTRSPLLRLVCSWTRCSFRSSCFAASPFGFLRAHLLHRTAAPLSRRRSLREE